MDDIHLLAAHRFRYELRLGGMEKFSAVNSKFGARKVCIASQHTRAAASQPANAMQHVACSNESSEREDYQ